MTISLSTFLESTFQGAQGSQGIQGTQGVGSQGAAGSQGTQGIQGGLSSQGTSGSQGAQGVQGTSGSQGTEGSQGAAGSQGAQGIQGTQGTFGPATIPQNSQTTGYTLQSSDNGKHIAITTGGVTVPVNVFLVGENVVIYNNSGVSQTITEGANITLRYAGTSTTGNRTLAQYGVCTVLCVADVNNADVFIISGAGLT